MLSERAYNVLALVVVVLLALVGISVSLRGRNDPYSNINQIIPTFTPEARGSKVRRNLANVLLRPRDSGSFTKLNDDEWHGINDRDHVVTDAEGEGLLNFRDCMSIYIFHSSELTTAPCSKAEYRSGNVICSVAGTSVFNNACNSKVIIQTETAEISLDGTWVTVIYLPARKLTLMSVTKGEATMWPVKNTEGRILGEPIKVPAGKFCFSTLGDSSPSINDLPARQPLPLRTIPVIAKELKVVSWLDKVKKKAEQDKVLPPQTDEADGENDNRGAENVSVVRPTGNTTERSLPKRHFDLRQEILRLLKDKDMSEAEIKRSLKLSDKDTKKWLNTLLKEQRIIALKGRPVRYRRLPISKRRRR